MMTRKMLMWIGAGLLSVATIPAVGATASKLAHSKKSTALVSTVSTKKPTARKTVRTVSSKKKVASRSHRALTARHLPGVTSMHSGHTKATATKHTTSHTHKVTKTVSHTKHGVGSHPVKKLTATHS